MKANELMIEDWVYLNTDEGEKLSCKVREIFAHRLIVFNLKGAVWSNEDTEEWFTPIPLTEEILEKNGIKKRGDEYVVFGWDGAKQWSVALEDFKPHFDFWFITSSDRDLNVRGKIRFVHELQHALRFCGLNDLADNFIV